jgi:hypothetical protein
MKSRIFCLCVLLVSTVAVGLPAAETQKLNAKVASDDFLPDYDTINPLVERADAVVRLKITGTQMRKFEAPKPRAPRVLMEHTADVLEVLKGSIGQQQSFSFFQRAGTMDVGDYKVSHAVRAEGIPEKGEEIVVFLRWNKGGGRYELLSQNQGLYRLDAATVEPKGKGNLVRRYKGTQRNTFLDDVRVAARTQR